MTVEQRLLSETFWSGETEDELLRILKSNPDINIRNDEGETPLHIAVMHCKFAQVIEKLLAQKANFRARDERGRTPLHLAAAHSEIPEILEAICNYFVDIGAQDGVGDTPLHYAAMGKTPKVVELLLDRGVNGAITNDEGSTPFDVAKRHKHLKGSYAYWLLNDAKFNDKPVSGHED